MIHYKSDKINFTKRFDFEMADVDHKADVDSDGDDK